MPFKKRHRKKSGKINKRLNQLEKAIIPLEKTFEQRSYDFIAPAAPTYDGTPLLYTTPVVWRGSDMYPTQQSGANIAPVTNYDYGTVRLGDKITFRHLSLQGEIRACVSNAVASESSNLVRMILVQFKESVAALTNAEICSAVLQQYPTATGTAINSVMACHSQYKNVVTATNNLPIVKYKVLKDKLYRLYNPKVANGGDEPWRRGFNIDQHFKEGLVMQYGKTLSVQPDINQIVLICLSDSTVAPHPDMTLISRAKYMDA